MHTSEFTDIGYELADDGIVTVSLNTPRRKNAISGLTALELRWAAQHFQEDDRVQAMILTGAPDPDSEPSRQAFSSGGYFVPGVYDEVPEEIMAQIDQTDIAMKATVLQFFGCDKPVLAAVNGLAIGGGITLTLVPPRGAGASIRAMKRIVHAQQVEALTRALDLENQALNQLMKSEDFVEGLMANLT
jgi:enoyl-CoA hydratase/carnithine racemase